MFKKIKLWKNFGYILLFIGPSLGVFLGAISAPIRGAIFATAITILGNFWVGRAEDLKREISIKFRLDEESLKALKKLDGLMFTREEMKKRFNIDISIQTIRYLIQHDIIENNVFPTSVDEVLSWGYHLTDFGKSVLRKQIGINLFPDIIIDMYRTNYYSGHTAYLQEEQRKFKNKYKRSFDDCLNNFFDDISSKPANTDSYSEKSKTLREFLESTEKTYKEKMKVIERFKKLKV